MFGSPATDAALESRVASLEQALASALAAIGDNKDDADGQIEALSGARAEGDAASQDGIDAAIAANVERTDAVDSRIGGEIQARVAEIARVENKIEDYKSITILKSWERISLREIGGKPVDEDPEYDNRARIQELLDFIDTPQFGGRDGILDGKTYRTTPIDYTADHNINLRGVLGYSRIVGINPPTEDEYGNAVVRIDGSSYRPTGSISGIDVDARGRIFLDAARSGSGFNLRNFRRLRIRDCDLISGDTYEKVVAPDGNVYGGDTALAITLCDDVVIENVYGRGWLDKFGYFSGSQVGDPDTIRSRIAMVNCMAEWCNTFASGTRQNELLQVSGGWARDCANGLAHTETGDMLPPGQLLHVSNFWMDRVGRPYRLWGGLRQTIIKGSGVRDWGRDPATGAPMPSVQAAVSGRGLQNADIDLHLAMRDWIAYVTENYAGYDFRKYDLDGRQSYGNKVRGYVAGLPLGYAVIEQNGTGPNDIELNVDNVGTARADSHLISKSVGTSNSRITHIRSDGPRNTQMNNKLFKAAWTPRVIAVGNTGFVFGASKGNVTASVNGTNFVVTNANGITIAVGDSPNQAAFGTGATIAEQLTSTEAGGALGGAGTYRLSAAQSTIASTSFAIIDTGKPSTSECWRQRVEDGIMTWGRVIIPFVYKVRGTITASVSGKVLAVSDAGGVLLGASRGTVTGSVDGDLWTVNEAGTASIVAGDWPKHASIAAGTTVLNQVSSSEHDGALGKAGVYKLSQAQSTIATTTFDVINSAALLGLRNSTLPEGTLPVGAYIAKQLSGVAGGAGTYELNVAVSAPIASTTYTVLGSGDIRFTGLDWAAALGGGDGEGTTGIDAGVLFPADATDICANVPAGQAYVRFREKGNAKRFMRTIDLDLAAGILRLQFSVTYRAEELAA